VNRSVPYFKEIDAVKDGRPNKIVQDLFEKLSNENISLTHKLDTVTGLEEIPDGIL